MAEKFEAGKSGDIVLTPISADPFNGEQGRVIGPARVENVVEEDMYEVTFALGTGEGLLSKHGVVGPYTAIYHAEELRRVEVNSLKQKYESPDPTFNADEVGSVPAARPELHE